MKQITDIESCAQNEAATPMEITSQETVAPTVKCDAADMKTKPASEEAKSDGEQVRSGWCLNAAGELARPVVELSSEVEAKPVKWLWENKIPRGNLSMIAGPGGVGKSFWTINMAAHITNGADWADGTPCEEGSVLFFHGEDGLADVYKQRFAANGVKENRVAFIKDKEVSSGNGVTKSSITVEEIEVIRQAILDTARQTGVPVKAVFIDPITNYLGRVHRNSGDGIRSVLRPLQQLAEEMDVSFVLVHHFVKGKRSDFQQLVSGSSAFVECCRAVWAVSHDSGDENKRYFAPVKFNYGCNPTAVSYRIGTSGKVEVLETDIHKTGEEITDEIAASKKAGRPQKALAEASRWLVDLLNEGEKPVKEIYVAAEAQGFSERTVDRAKEALGVKSTRRGFGKDSYSVWSLP